MVYMNRFHCGDCSFNLYVLGFVIIVVTMNNNLTNCKLDCTLDTTLMISLIVFGLVALDLLPEGSEVGSAWKTLLP